MPVNRGYAYEEVVEGPTRRVVDHLTKRHERASAEEWLARVANGEVTVDGVIADATTVIRAGQRIIWHRPPWDEPSVPTNWSVVFEDEALLCVNKPTGLPTMPGGGFVEGTLLSLVRRAHREASPLHRLGRHTSGLVLFSRTAVAAQKLSESFRDHSLAKQYVALGSGVAAFDAREVDAKIGPVPHPVLGTVHAASAAGRPAQSAFAVLERRADSTLFSVLISSGRPHQIRIHAGVLGHPLVGDPLYGVGGLPKSDAVPGDGGYLLHAERLSFDHPITGSRIELRAAPPAMLAVGGSQP